MVIVMVVEVDMDIVMVVEVDMDIVMEVVGMIMEDHPTVLPK